MEGKRLLGFILSVCMVLSLLPCPVLAAQEAPASAETQESEPAVPTEEWDNDALFAAYVEKTLYGGLDDDVSLLSARHPARENLPTEFSKNLYDALKTKVTATAASGGSAVYEISVTDLTKNAGYTWTTENTGLSALLSTYNASGQSVFTSEFRNWLVSDQCFAVSSVIRALEADLPYEFYWADNCRYLCELGTMGLAQAPVITNSVIDQSTVAVTMDQIRVKFLVAKGYQDTTAAEEERTYTVQSLAEKVTQAKENAKSIVDSFAGKSEYERLKGYMETICEWVSYDYELYEQGQSGSVDYGDPWQLIYVFDDDRTNKVVCQGYARAFQYLCDLTTDWDVDCYTVTGFLGALEGDGVTGAGGHAWNIVTYQGKNYLVDVTNCDKIPVEYGLFMACGTRHDAAQDGYDYAIAAGGSTASYKYIKGTWGDDILTLSETGFSLGTLTGSVDIPQVNNGYEDGYGLVVMAEVSGTPSDASLSYQWYLDDQPVTGAGEFFDMEENNAGKYVGHTLQVKVTSNNYSGSLLSPKYTIKKTFPGYISITNESQAKFGDTLVTETTAHVAGGLDGLTLSYQWYREDAQTDPAAASTYTAIPSATESTYTVTADDVGHKLKVQVTAENYTFSSRVTTDAIASADQTAPTKPVIDSANLTSDSITVTAVEGEEYACSTTTTVPEDGWSTDGVFTGLKSNTTYYIFARKAAKPGLNASAASGYTTVKTPLPQLTGTVTITGPVEYYRTLEATVTGVPEGANLRYQWFYGTTSMGSSSSSNTKKLDNQKYMNQYIKVVVTASNYSGSLTVTTDVPVGKNTAALSAPSISNVMASYVQTNYSYGYGYQYIVKTENVVPKKDSSDWKAIPSGSTIRGLEPGTTYYIFVKRVTDYYDTEPSKGTEFTTKDTPAVSYLDYNSATQKVDVERETRDYLEITKDSTTWKSGWYAVKGDVTIDGRVTVSGNVHLILTDGCHLTVTNGINIESSRSLTIYSQSDGSQQGVLTSQSTTDYYYAGIGFHKLYSSASEYDRVTITINGGKVNASAKKDYGPGIGGDSDYFSLYIHGGDVYAVGGYNAAGIGNGKAYGASSSAMKVVITGGHVIAATSYGAAAIGGGYGNAAGEITISGGYVEARGTIGAGNAYSSSAWPPEPDRVPGSGSFSTGTNGNAMIVAGKISDTSHKSSWKGLIITGDEGKLYNCNEYTLKGDLSLSSRSLTIEKGKTLIVPEGLSLTASANF